MWIYWWIVCFSFVNVYNDLTFLCLFLFLFKTGTGDAKHTTNISVKRTKKTADSFVLLSWDSFSPKLNAFLSMFHKGRSTHKRRWTLTLPHTSGGISFPTSICCRLLSTLLLLVEENVLFNTCTVLAVAFCVLLFSVHCSKETGCEYSCILVRI